MKILLGADHAGFELKNKIKAFLSSSSEKYSIEDMGAHELNATDDYPAILAPLAIKVAEQPEEYKAIIFGGSGQGEAMVCNRFPGVRAAVYYGSNLDIIKLSREHNDSNVLSIGARFVDEKQAIEAVSLWLETTFSKDERHIRRINMLDNIE